MTHSEIEQREISERYVRGQLAPEERRAFQEHFFVCDECFQQVQVMERFIAGVRHAAEAGKLAPLAVETPAARPSAPWKNWLGLAFAATAAASVILTAALGWLLLYQLPRVSGELTRERQAREQAETERRQQLKSASERLEAERQERARLESQLEQERARARDSEQRPEQEEQQRRRDRAGDEIAMVTGPQPNVPLAVLEATRAAESGATELGVPAGARSVVLWLEVAPSRFESFRMRIYAAGNRPVEAVAGLKRNSEGALSVSLPARSLPPGRYTVKLYGVGRQAAELVGEYRLQIRKR